MYIFTASFFVIHLIACYYMIISAKVNVVDTGGD